jgi:hypothetical protein
MKALISGSLVSSFSRRLACAAVVSLAVGAAFAPAAAIAADRFSVISIANETNANINVVYHWGDGQEKTYRFTPGAQHWFSYAYSRPDENRSPDFHIKFDADTTNQRYSEFKKLHGYRAPDQSYNLGHKYVFKYDGPAKRFIEMYDRK